MESEQLDNKNRNEAQEPAVAQGLSPDAVVLVQR
jgi:hypothetical protein